MATSSTWWSVKPKDALNAAAGRMAIKKAAMRAVFFPSASFTMK